MASVLHRANLARAIVTGNQPGQPQEAISRTWPVLGALVLAAVLGFWAYPWWARPAASAVDAGAALPQAVAISRPA